MGEYLYVWDYRVAPENTDAFVELYGPGGAWVSLFQMGNGYEGTELFQDVTDSQHFITVDRWTSKTSFDQFFASSSVEFAELDARGEMLTVSEARIG